MATLSQHYDTNFDVNPYYVPINKQLSPMYDKSKKTWSQRLKITKSEKSTAQMVVPQLPPPPQLQPQQLQLAEYPGGLDFPPSALSRSMKYAEPWIYGTVRGIPARPMHFLPGQAMFAPMPSEIAVVICSCPEYLNGTKRDVKKASVCKKCKGSRLPLAQIGGTVRIRPTSAPLQHKLRPTNASTLRVVSSKSRPSILDPQRDPYDLMRRTRLLSPEPKCSTPQPEKGYRSSRGKSSSPNRSRSRTPRSQLEDSGKASPKQNSAKTDRWIVEDGIQPTKDTNHRRSILRCNVNPYDLISNKSSSSSSSSVQHLSEFSPNHHDDDDDDVVADIFGVTTSNAINQRAAISRKTTGPGTVSSPSPSTASSSTTTNGSSCSTPQTSTYTSSGSPTTSAKTMNYANVKAIAGQRISFGESTSSSSLITQNGDSFSYESITSVPLNAESSGGSPKLQKQQSCAKKDDNPIQTKATTNQPKRPPRRKNDMNPSLGGSSDDNDNSVVTAANPSNEHHYQVSSQTSTDPPAAAASQRPSIKSILKRPPPSPASTVTSPKSPSNGDTDAGSPVASTDNACRFDHHHRQQHHHQIKRNSARTHESPAKSPPASGSATFPAVGMDAKLPKSTGERKTAAETKTGSQFYIPLPQARKKVQFMVEDKIIRVEHNDGGAQRDDEVNDDNDNANDNDHDDDDDEDDYHSAQGDDDDRNEISKQISKPRMANNQDGSRSRSAASTSDTNRNLSQDNANEDGHRICENKVSSNVADVTRNPKDNKASPPVAAANRFSHEQQHYSQRRHQIHLQQQQQEAVLNQLQHESNLVSSELLNSPRGGGYYQNLLHRQHQCQDHRQEHRQEHHQDEPHYEDVADEHVDDDNEDEDDDKDDEEDEDDDDRQTVVLADDSSSATDPVNGQPRTEDPSADDLRTVTKAATTASTTASPTSGALSRNAIRRTHSERHPCNVNIGTSSTNVILNFKDTMALRMKATRKDSRDVFSGNDSGSNCGIGTQQSVGLFRPKEPPPPPPTPGGMANLGNHKQQHQQQPKQQQQQQIRLSNTRTNVTAKETPPTPVAAGGSSKTQTILITATKDDSDDKRSNNCDIADDGNEDAATKDNDSNCQQRGEHPTSNRRLSVSRSGLEEQKQPLFKGNDTSQRRLSSSSHQDTAATKNIYETFDSFSQADPSPLKAQASPKYTFGSTSQPNRTVVRVAPFNKTSSEVHRLKITHTDEDTKTSGGRNSNNSAGSQKKTSILITGDDCYSTVNVTNDTPLYQSSVVVADGSSSDPMLKVTSNTVTINVVNSSPRTPEEELIYKNNKINTLLSRGATRAIIPIGGGLSNTSFPDPVKTTPKRGRTLITLDYEQSPSPVSDSPNEALTPSPSGDSAESDDVFCHEEELVKILRNPVEAVRRNLVPHICGKADSTGSSQNSDAESKCSKRPRKRPSKNELTVPSVSAGGGGGERHSFVSKLLEDPTLSQLADGLESDVVVKLIENSLKRLQESRSSIDTSGTKDNEDMNRLINSSLQRIKEERHKLETNSQKSTPDVDELQEIQSNRGSISSGNSFSSANYEMFDFSDNNESDCYQSCSSEIAADVDTPLETRSKFYQMLVDATLAEIEISMNAEEDHHYESIRGVGGSNNGDPIYEEITDIPPPLPLSPPPLNDPELEKKAARSMFEGASKYDILSYLVDAKERGLVREESFEYNINNTSNPIIIEEENDTLSDLKQISDMSSRISHLSVTSDSSEDTTSLTGSMVNDRLSVISALRKGTSSEIERNDSGVGSETSKSSRSKYQNNPQAGSVLSKISPIHLCEDCDGPVETQVTDSGVMFAPLVCRKCGKKRAERKEIITEIVETEEKYGRDLQIILEEFCQPMLVAGLLTQEQLSAIFLNTEELLENNQTLAERMRDALDIALEQGDDDLLTVNIGKIFLEFTQMLHAFESYCVRQAGASLLLANLEKEKELLRIFLKVSQMENTVLRRMNLNSFLMVPVQRVTKYPLLLARLYKVTPSHLEGRDLLKQAQEKIELHLTHINQEAKDVPTKLWRRISSSSPNRRASCEIDMINIKLRKMAIDILEWNHDEVRFAMEGRLLYTQPTDSNWKKARTIKLNPVNALLVTNGKPSGNYKAEKAVSDHLNFPKHTGIREASLLVVKEKCGRYTLIREPLYLDRCIVCTEADWDEYFELQEISSKDTFIFKAEDGVRTKQWYTQLQYHAQGMGAWRKRRNALANIMINGMLSRT